MAAKQNGHKHPQEHPHARPFHNNIIVNYDKDNDDESWFDFRPFPTDNSCLSCSVSFDDNNFEKSITRTNILVPPRSSTARPRDKGYNNITMTRCSVTEADDDDDDIEEQEEVEDDEGPAEVSVSEESNSVYSDSISCSESFDSNRIELIQLEENDESLVDLTLDCRSMDDELASEIFVHLRGNTHLKVLRLKCGARHHAGNNGSPHQEEEEAFCKIVSALKYNVSVECLNISGAMTINREISSSLASSMAHNSRIQSIRMHQCKFVGSSLAILLVAMQHMKQIRQLSFHSCDWEEHNTETIASSLPYLNLNSLSLVGMNIASGVWPYLYKNILHSENLVELDLSRNYLDQQNVRLLTKSLTMSKNSIKTLALSRCGLTYPCAKELYTGLRDHPSLTSLNISHNPRLTDKSAIFLKDLIKYNRSITNLQVQNCNLSTYSVNSIDSGLRYNNSILKTFFSETASMAIFEVVDIIGKFDMLDAVPSFGGSNFTPFEKESKDENSAPRRKKPSGNNVDRSKEHRTFRTKGKENLLQPHKDNIL